MAIPSRDGSAGGPLSVRSFRRTLALAGLFIVSQTAPGGSVVGSRHDMRTPWMSDLCQVCHAPRNASTDTLPGPLWDRARTASVFPLYGNSMIDSEPAEPGTSPATPGAVSRFCLSCHDGVNATAVHSNFVNTRNSLLKRPEVDKADVTSGSNCERCNTDTYSGQRRPLGPGIGFASAHPVAMPYPRQDQNHDYNIPPDLDDGWGLVWPSDVKLFAGGVECASCHDVHNPDVKPFMRASRSGNALCMTCHRV